MAFKLIGNSNVAAEVSGTGFRALRVEPRPLDIGSLGTYRVSVLSGTMAAGLAGASEVVQFLWSDATRLAVIHSITLDGLGGTTTTFTAGLASVRLFAARSFTVAGTGGGIATLSGNNNKLRSSMGTTLAGEIRVATTAALTAGTKTLDAQPFGQYAFSVGTAASVQYAEQVKLFDATGDGTYPLVLAQNEGWILQATVPATGTWQFGLTVCWSEVSSY
jgi:hypothetical protein